MPERKNIIDGYEFESMSAYETARKEAETIAYIKSNTDLRDEQELRKVYEEYTKDVKFQTPVGVGFLREIQKRIARDPEYRKTMKAIPVKMVKIISDPSEMKSRAAQEKNKSLEDVIKGIRIRRNIIIAFLSVLILLLCGWNIYEMKKTADPTREEILNEYAGWADELAEKEEYLREWELRLSQGGHNN